MLMFKPPLYFARRKVGSKATLGDMSGLRQGFKSPISMVDGGEYNPDKAYKDSKLVSIDFIVDMLCE